MQPEMTVLMPVFNAAYYLQEAIQSVLEQSFSEFELLVINDGSSDQSGQILDEYARQDHRIRVLSQPNRGIVKSLNRGVEAAKGHYIVRMDADDICMPERLAEQYRFMNANPDVGISGGWVELFGQRSEIWHHRQEDNHIRNMLLFKTSGFAHSTVIARRSLLLEYPYDDHFPHVEDTACWTRIAVGSKVRFANLPRVLCRYRVHPEQVSEQHRSVQRQSYEGIVRAYLESLGVAVTDQQMALHMRICECGQFSDMSELEQAAAWLIELRRGLEPVLPDNHGVFRQRWENLLKANAHLDVQQCQDLVG